MRTRGTIFCTILCCGLGLLPPLAGCGIPEDGICTDADEDGYFTDAGCGTLSDCDDKDAGVYPGALESGAGSSLCTDGKDNDCDDLVDDQENGCQPCTVDEDCDDANPCTDDTCVTGGCAYTDNTDPCDDQDECTSGDTCSGGICKGTILPECSDLVPGVTVGSISPLSVERYEDDPFSQFTLLMNGYNNGMFGEKASEVVFLHNETRLALWVYDAEEIGGLNFGHSVTRKGDELLISDTDHDRVIIVRAMNGLYSYDPDFQLVWDSGEDANLDLAYPNDADFLSDGNLLITDRDHHRVIEVNRTTGTIQWQFGVFGRSGQTDLLLNGPHNADRLSNGNTIVADSNNGRILEIRANGSIAWEYDPTGSDLLRWPRDADALENGNVLITDSNNGRVIEVDEQGDIVWEYRVSIIGTMSEPYEADLLPNGNVLISCPGAKDGAVYEVSYATQRTVWSFP